jgi:hypothetical protein
VRVQQPHNLTLQQTSAGSREFHRPFRGGGRPLCLRHSPASAAPRSLLRCSPALAAERKFVMRPTSPVRLTSEAASRRRRSGIGPACAPTNAGIERYRARLGEPTEPRALARDPRSSRAASSTERASRVVRHALTRIGEGGERVQTRAERPNATGHPAGTSLAGWRRNRLDQTSDPRCDAQSSSAAWEGVHPICAPGVSAEPPL